MKNNLTRMAAWCVVLTGTSYQLIAEPTDFSEVDTNTGFLIKLKVDTRSSKRSTANDGWQLMPLSSEATTRGEERATNGWWYLAPRPSTPGTRAATPTPIGSGWDAAYDIYTGKTQSATRGRAGVKTPLQARGIDSSKIEFVEPDFGSYFPVAEHTSGASATASNVSSTQAVTGSPTSPHWPTFPSIGAYQDADHSQLAAARAQVEQKIATDHLVPVKVAFLDTGYDPNHISCPNNIDKTGARNFVESIFNFDGIPLDKNPGPAGSQHHGVGTIGIFGGRAVDIVDQNGRVIFSGPLGGAPFAQILPMRVANSVIHLENPGLETWPSGTTRAIYYAIRQNCDVISMSHGGLPSLALADAVNAAYNAGIAMFFASGDYLQWEAKPLHSPTYVVYPAAFPRTMCVCGVTATNKTYGIPPKTTYDESLDAVQSWRLRGNWGPPIWMQNAIAAFSPNVPWPHQPDPKNHETAENVIDLDGQGTSAATPQAAAAATIWLQYYRREIEQQNAWRTWRKAEFAYAALRATAKRSDDPSDPKYSATYFGTGILQAAEALKKSPDKLAVKPQKAAWVGLGWMRLFKSLGTKTRGIQGARDEVLQQMFGLELAQLAQRSTQLQEIISRYNGFEPDATDESLSDADFQRFKSDILTAVKSDANASQHLKDAASELLSKNTPPP